MDEKELNILIPTDLENLKLPSPTLLGFYKDRDSRILWLEYEVDGTLHENITKDIIRWNKEDKDIPIEDRKPIKIFFNSPGGDLEITMALIGVMEISKTPIWTINAGWAYSAAGLVLMAGHKRFALPRTKCLIHNGSGFVGGDFNTCQAMMDDYKKIVSEVHDFILSKTDIDPKFFKKKKDIEWYLDTKEQLSHGVVQEVVSDIESIL